MKNPEHYLRIFFLTFFCLGGYFNICAQNRVNYADQFHTLRMDNAVEAAIGAATPAENYTNSQFALFMRLGYKRYVTPHININANINRFNLAYKDVTKEGFMSFDVNIEITLLPYNKLSPFIYIGGGLNTYDVIRKPTSKMQGGLGMEYLVLNNLGIKIFSDYNQVFNDELDGGIYGDSELVFWRAAAGINFYFGGSKRKVKSKSNTSSIINSYQIISK